MKTIEQLENLCDYCDIYDKSGVDCCDDMCQYAYKKYLEENECEDELFLEDKKMDNEKILDISFNISEEQLEDKIIDNLESNIINRIVDRISIKYIDKLNDKIDEMYDNISSNIENAINDKIKTYINNIYDEFVIKVPESSAWNSPMVDVKLKDYVLKLTQDKIEKGVVICDGWNNSPSSLNECFKKQVDKTINTEIDSQIKQQVGKIKIEVNSKLKNVFDTATKDMLSEQVFNLLMSNDTYVKMQNGLKLLNK